MSDRILMTALFAITDSILADDSVDVRHRLHLDTKRQPRQPAAYGWWACEGWRDRGDATVAMSLSGRRALRRSRSKAYSRVSMRADCQPARGPYLAMIRALGCDRPGSAAHLATGQKAAANRCVIAVVRKRSSSRRPGGAPAQGTGLAWLEAQAEVAEGLVAERWDATQQLR